LAIFLPPLSSACGLWRWEIHMVRKCSSGGRKSTLLLVVAASQIQSVLSHSWRLTQGKREEWKVPQGRGEKNYRGSVRLKKKKTNK
jgi:hypothetical protein